jgi:hypothetical protein
MKYKYGEQQWNDFDRAKRRIRRETCLNVTLFTTNPTWTDTWERWPQRWKADINRLSHLLMLVEFCVNIHWFQRQCHIWQHWHFEACDSRPLHVKTTTINFIKTSHRGRAITMRRALSIFRLIRYSQHPVHKTHPLKLCRLRAICFHYADSFYFI